MHARLRSLGLVGVLALILGLMVVAAPAHAVDEVKFTAVKQTPAPLVFDSENEPIAITQDMEVPSTWEVHEVKVFICTALDCNRPGSYFESFDLLHYAGPGPRNAQFRSLNFTGTVPNYLRSFSYYLSITFDAPPIDGLNITSPYVSYTSYVSGGNTFYYGFGYVYGYGKSVVDIHGPAQITQGASLTLNGTATCFSKVGGVGQKAPDYASIYPEYRLPGQSTWNRAQGVANYTPATGAWSYFIPAWGATADWRAFFSYGQDCQYGTTSEEVIRVVAGDATPPPVVLPGEPGLVIGEVTTSTVALDWAPATGANIVSYKLGWTTPSGLPVPEWFDVYTNPDDPFVMTNLNPDTDYVMYIEAITASGLPGARNTESVHTDAPVISEPPPPPPPTDVNCSDFATQAAAQVFFLASDPVHDPHGLDGDHDMIACELLPCPCSYSTTPTPPTPPGTPLPPPPPPPVVVAVAVDGKVVAQKVHGTGKKGYALRFRSYQLPAGTVQGARLVWKVKVDGLTKQVIKQDAAEVYRLAIMKRMGTGTHKVVILKNGSKVEVLKIKTG